MSQTLQSQLAADILLRINAQALPVGARLSERSLAEALRVSRSPVRTALRQLADRALIDPHPEGGYVVGKAALKIKPAEVMGGAPDEAVYLRIAQERLDGLLPSRVSENELMRRYGVTRGQLGDILRRISNEGWIERLPGHGWEFSEAMTSPAAYAQAYRYRVLVEPACILEPGFKVDAVRLRQCRLEQEALIKGEIDTVSPAQIFDANTRLHETIASCSGNAFILDSLRRINRVRRLMEYRKAVDRKQALRRCEEHLVLIDLLLANKLARASEMMEKHLKSASREKQS
ncbi:GntR family transcriptional regulator [Achromobacter aloeverae]|uniref:GntR family transcriptional regulator n=1 Tax=Achromobacter aloeverae TaxID=1750518 RepID=A0A4V1MSV0_9BURK|nr:GntR family transcriptional regulator [Achromobacter aloeverae]RXN93310.1 GntR family transcriptional regulator [Achromobacter aloeverae]